MRLDMLYDRPYGATGDFSFLPTGEYAPCGTRWWKCGRVLLNRATNTRQCGFVVVMTGFWNVAICVLIKVARIRRDVGKQYCTFSQHDDTCAPVQTCGANGPLGSASKQDIHVVHSDLEELTCVSKANVKALTGHHMGSDLGMSDSVYSDEGNKFRLLGGV